MFKNFLLISFRNLARYKVVTFINLSGLILGFLCSLLILEYVLYERSYDNFHSKGDHIYRLAYNRYQGGKLLWKTANSFCPSGPFLKENFPEVREYVTLQRFYNITVCRENEKGEKICFNESKSYYATHSIFNVFDFKLLKGKTDCLARPNQAVMTRRAARKYFGDEDPMGKMLRVNNLTDYIITGVIGDIPENSHLQFDFLFSFPTLVSGDGSWVLNNWEFDYFYNYILLQPGTDLQRFTRNAFTKMIALNYADIQKSRNEHDEFYLQPLRSLHLFSNIEYEPEKPGNGNALRLLFAFSLFLALIAWINYINLVTSRSLERAREVGIRKVSGSSRRLLIVQFLVETCMINLASLGITAILFSLINPAYCAMLRIDPSTFFHHAGFLFSALLIFLSGILLSGFYPAVILSSFIPSKVLKGEYKNSERGMVLRKSLISFQFFISFLLLVGTLISYRQVLYLMRKDMGIDYHSTLVIQTPKPESNRESFNSKIEVFRNQIRDMPWVAQTTLVTDVPGEEINNWFWCYRKGMDAGDGKAYFRIGIDENYFDFFKVRFLAGRGFSQGRIADREALVINRSAMRRLGFENPAETVNQIVTQGKNDMQIIGVVDDFHYKSVKVEPVPTVFNLQPSDKSYWAIKYPGGNNSDLSRHIRDISVKFGQVFPGSPFEYSMLDDKMSSDLDPDKSFRSVFSIFSLLAVVVALIGLLGLLYITVSQKMKTMVIRIILGAQRQDIFRHLSLPVFIQVSLCRSLGRRQSIAECARLRRSGFAQAGSPELRDCR